MKHILSILLVFWLSYPSDNVSRIPQVLSSISMNVEDDTTAKEPLIDTVDITMTRFYPSDSTGSDSCMATMCISKLSVNEKGWYTYKDRVVIAAATNACLQRCKNRVKYGPFPKDFRIYDYYDEIQFVIEETTYTGVILDSCGACMYHINGEALQRYDIYTVSGKASSSLLSYRNAGKIKAQLLISR